MRRKPTRKRSALVSRHSRPIPVTLTTSTSFLLCSKNGATSERASNQATAAVASFQSAIKLIEGRSSVAADQLYDLAAVHAKLSTMASESGAGLKADEARVEADKAMASLNRAVSTGFRKFEQIRKDPDFDTLRNRDDFKKLLERLKSSVPASSAPAD